MYEQDTEQSLVAQSTKFEEDKKYEYALPVDRELLWRFPDNQEYKIRLSNHLLRAADEFPKEEVGRVMAYLNEAIELNPEGGDAYNNRGTCWADQGIYGNAVADYLMAIDKKADDPDFYENLGDAYNALKQYKEAIPCYSKSILLYETAGGISPKDLANIYHARGDCRYAIKDFKGAVADYSKEIEMNEQISPEIKKDYAYVYNDRGLAWYAQYRYEEAIDNYQDAAAADGESGFCHHNLYLAYIKTGQYDLAYDHLKQAKALYLTMLELALKSASDDDALQYYGLLAELHLYSYIDSDILKVESFLDEGLLRSPDDWDLHITAARYFTNKKYLVCQNNASRDRLASLEDQVLTLQNDCLRKASRHYQAVCDLYTVNEAYARDRDKVAEMAGLHLLFERTGEAAKGYDLALALDPRHVTSLVGKGVILAGQKKFEESIVQFQQAALSDPDDMNTQTNIAEARFRSGQYTEAERIYRRILALAVHNQDAVIGLGELFKTMGDQAKEKNNKTDAEDYYKMAEDWYSKALEWQVSFDAKKVIPSRRLSLNDIASIKYSLAYIGVTLYELTATAASQDRGLLKTARSFFAGICKGTDEYYKARASIRKIDKALGAGGLLTTKAGAWVVISLAMALLAGAQYLFYFPGQHEVKEYSITSGDLKHWIRTGKLEGLYTAVSKIADTSFVSETALDKYFHALLGSRDSVVLPDITSIATAKVLEVPNKERVLTEASYIAISFGCLAFIIAGFFMGQISKLKVAGLELEKNVIDQINTNLQSLGISPAD
jgi:tetratricopeptide (TPR) repeat protein